MCTRTRKGNTHLARPAVLQHSRNERCRQQHVRDVHEHAVRRGGLEQAQLLKRLQTEPGAPLGTKDAAQGRGRQRAHQQRVLHCQQRRGDEQRLEEDDVERRAPAVCAAEVRALSRCAANAGAPHALLTSAARRTSAPAWRRTRAAVRTRTKGSAHSAPGCRSATAAALQAAAQHALVPSRNVRTGVGAAGVSPRTVSAKGSDTGMLRATAPHVMDLLIRLVEVGTQRVVLTALRLSAAGERTTHNTSCEHRQRTSKCACKSPRTPRHVQPWALCLHVTSAKRHSSWCRRQKEAQTGGDVQPVKVHARRWSASSSRSAAGGA